MWSVVTYVLLAFFVLHAAFPKGSTLGLQIE